MWSEHQQSEQEFTPMNAFKKTNMFFFYMHAIIWSMENSHCFLTVLLYQLFHLWHSIWDDLHCSAENTQLHHCVPWKGDFSANSPAESLHAIYSWGGCSSELALCAGPPLWSFSGRMGAPEAIARQSRHGGRSSKEKQLECWLRRSSCSQPAQFGAWRRAAFIMFFNTFYTM